MTGWNVGDRVTAETSSGWSYTGVVVAVEHGPTTTTYTIRSGPGVVRQFVTGGAR